MTTPRNPETASHIDTRFAAQRERLAKVANTPGAPMLVLRAFLGITFVFAGLQKLANPDFFNAKSTSSFQAQLHGAMATSPIHSLLGLVNHAPVVIAVLIACSEVAVGIGTLLGLFGRVAALGGMLLALSFFLTISYATSPYYFGSDIVFVFAWTPLVLGGSGRFSADDWLRQRADSDVVLADPRATGATIDRRTALRQLGALGLAGVVTGALIGVVTGIGRSISHPRSSASASSVATSTTTTSIPTSTNSGKSSVASTSSTLISQTKIASTADIPVGGAAGFTDTIQQIPAFVVHPDEASFVAFSAICTHAGCTVSYDSTTTAFVCPCHGSSFNAKTGAVLQGPATRALPSIAITESDGAIYLKT